jgi:hypothetical protein
MKSYSDRSLTLPARRLAALDRGSRQDPLSFARPDRFMPRLGICWDKNGWWHKYVHFCHALGIECGTLRLEASDWLERIESYTHILWRPNLEAPYFEEAREKLFFMETILRKRTFPNWSTFWHYNNKRAQYYLFRASGIPTPPTFISYQESEVKAALPGMSFPVVSKSAEGAASSAVRLLQHRRDAERESETVFRRSLFTRICDRLGIVIRRSRRSRAGYVLWQRFLAGNKRDLRITVIGKKHVFAFWRNNRPNDFRASGSGLIDYETPAPEEACALCVAICQRHHLDFMAFDIIFGGGNIAVLEMSCAFNDRAIYNAPFHYVASAEGAPFERSVGHVWPQKLVCDYVCEEMRRLDLESG